MSDLGFIHSFIPSERSDTPVLILLHGTGGNEEDLLPMGPQVFPGAPLLGIRGRVLENGMPRFFRRLAEGVFDQEDLKLRTAELADFLTRARSHYGLQRRKMVALGYSNGANIAASLLLSQAAVFDGAVLLRAMVPFQPEHFLHMDSVPVLLSAGEFDPIVPASNTTKLAELLQSAGADTSIHWHPGGHELGHDDLRAMIAWFARYKFTHLDS